MSQVVPLVVALLLAVVAAVGFRVFAMAGVPEQVSVVVAEVPLQPGEVFRSDMVRTATMYFSPGLRGILQEDEISGLEGGRILMFVPPGAVVPRTAIVPPEEDDAPGRLFNAAASGEHLMVIAGDDRIVSPPFSRLRPGDCMDMVAFFSGDTGGLALEAPSIGMEPAGTGETGIGGELPMPARTPTPVATPETPAAPGTAVTVTVPITMPDRPMAKWLARVVVRSVLDIPTTPRDQQASAFAAQPPRLMVAIPPEAGEGIVYALGAAEKIHLILVPPCERATIPLSPAFSEADLMDWVRFGRNASGAPVFFMSPTPTPAPKPAGKEGGETTPSSSP